MRVLGAVLRCLSFGTQLRPNSENLWLEALGIRIQNESDWSGWMGLVSTDLVDHDADTSQSPNITQDSRETISPKWLEPESNPALLLETLQKL